MALERLTLSPVIVAAEEHLNKPPRLPRWTRQELLVLIQGKRVAENRVRRGRMASPSVSAVVVEPKWSSVSSYCKRHGVNRGPVQCRKRWSNLAADFKKIKEWESSSSSQQKQESFWVMRNDLRRQRKLPGFFDREVYDILDVEPAAPPGDKSLTLSLAPSSTSQPQPQPDPDPDPEEEEVVFDTGRTNDGLFSDDDQLPPPMPTPAPTPISAKHSVSQPQGVVPPPSTEETCNPSPETDHSRKRKRADEDSSLHYQYQLIEAMERNGRLLTSQLEIQNTNSQLDREQRKDHANTLFAVLNKLADAMVKIADKL